MPQIAIIQTPSPQAPPAASPPAGREADSFSPHLDKAISSRQEQSMNRDKSAGKSDAPKENKTDNTNGSTAHGPTSSKEEGLANTDSSSETATDLKQAVDQTTQEDPFNIDANQQGSNNSPLFLFIVNALQADNRPKNDQQIGSTPVSLIKSPSTEGDTQANTLATSLAEQLGEASTETFTLPQGPQSQEVKPERDTILAQLQKIIENSDEYGKLSIKVNGSTLKVMPNAGGYQLPVPTADSPDDALTLMSAAATDITEVAVDSAANILPNTSEMPADKPNQNLNSVRHTIRQQYYEGKMILQEGQEKEATSQDNRQSETFTTNTAVPGENGIAPAVATDQTNTFAQPLASMQEGQKLPTVETSRPVALPSGTIIHQEEVIRQIAERFQISRRDLDTRVNIQLHPAELGELKIDLTVKDGTISANVVANSQYTQEIIERNMAKLRTVLENQGFVIDDIKVTAKSESTDNFNLFDQQLFSRNDYTPPAAKNIGNSETLFSLDTPGIYQQPAATSGVNVKI
jgi:flagellar hook-length control protein FliK